MFLQRSVIEFSFYYCSMIVVGVGGSLIYCKMEKKLSLTIHVVLFSYCYKNFLSFFLIISLYIYVCARGRMRALLYLYINFPQVSN